MKNFIAGVAFVLCIVLLSTVISSVRIVSIQYEDQVWYGDCRSTATLHRIETTLFGEVLCDERIEEVETLAGLGEFLADKVWNDHWYIELAERA